MSIEDTPLDQFRNDFIERRHDSGYEPCLDDLDEADRESAELFIRMMKASEGVNPKFTPQHAAMLLQIYEHNFDEEVDNMISETSSNDTRPGAGAKS